MIPTSAIIPPAWALKPALFITVIVSLITVFYEDDIQEVKQAPQEISYEIDKKYCVKTCVSFSLREMRIEDFSNLEHQVYNKIIAECRTFYNNEKCCYIRDLELIQKKWIKVLRTSIHGRNFGVCL